MAISNKYILAPDLQSLFRDKDTALPLNSGYILFYRDSSRTVGKEIFRLDGTYPAYTVVPYGFMDIFGAWRVDLTDFGALEFLPIYYPYDIDDNIDLYFIEVYSFDDVLQFTREGFPLNVAEINPGTIVDVNFIANGQFLLHTDIPPTLTTPVGQVTTAVTEVAYGGWTFERPSGSSAIDNITFQRYVPNNPEAVASPRYAIRIVNQSGGGGDTFKDLRVKFLDVNKFASTTQDYTFAYTGTSNGAGSVQANIYLIKNFGTGGTPSATTETLIGMTTINLATGILAVNFTFGINDSKTLGSNDDDFVQIAIRFPVGAAFDVSITDAILAVGNSATTLLPEFPQTTDAQFLYEGIAGQLQIPAYDGSKIGLGLILTRSGLAYDIGQVGRVDYMSLADVTTLPFYQNLCDGSVFKTSDYTAEGIPRSRLQSVLFSVPMNYPIYGTGTSFVTTMPLVGNADTFRLSTNTGGVVTAPSNGAASPGFTFFTIADGSTLIGDDVNAWAEGYNTSIAPIWIIDKGIAALTVAPSTDTAWAVFWASDYFASGIPTEDVLTFPITLVRIDTNASTLAGKYFLFQVTNGSRILVWFTVDGTGTIPIVAHDYDVRVDLKSTYAAEDVSGAIMETLNNRSVFTVQVVAGASITAGDYWLFDTLTDEFYVWYTIDGVGTDPLVANKIAIKVDALSTDSAAIIVAKTTTAINSAYYAVPDARGLYIRARMHNGGNNSTALLSLYAPPANADFSYYQTDLVGSHIHPNSLQTELIPLSHPGAVYGGGTDFDSDGVLKVFANNQFPENTVRSIQFYAVINI